MNKIKTKLIKYLNVTSTEDALSKINRDVLRRVRLVNYITLIAIINMLVYAVIYCFVDFWLFLHAIVFLCIASVISFGIIIINKRGNHLAAKILLSVLAPLFMTYISTIVFGKAPGFQVYLFVGAIIPLFLWSNKQKQYPISVISAIIIIYAYIEFFPAIFDPKIVLPENYINNFKLTNVAVCFFAAGIAIVTYQFLYSRKEDRLQFALKAASEGIFDINFKSMNHYLSPRWYTMLGYEPNELPPTLETIFSITHLDDKKKLEESFDNLRTCSVERADVELRLKTKQGGWFWVLSRSRIIDKDEHGVPIRLIGTHIDINDRRKAEETLIQAERRLSETQRIAHLGTWEFIPATGEINWSDETWRIWGYEPKPGGPPFNEYLESIHPDDRELLNKSVEKAAGGEPYEIELRHKRHDGTYNYVITQCEPIKKNGKVVKLLGTVLDITERKNAETSLRESEEKYRTVVENAGEGIFIIQGGHIVFANQTVVDILGFSREELSKNHFIELVHEEDREIVLQNHKKRLNNQTIPIYRVRVLTKNDSYITVEINATKYIYNGKPATLNFANDITDKLKAETELKENEARYRSFFTNSIEAISIFDIETMKFIDVNNAFCKMYDYTKEEALSLLVRDISAEPKNTEKAIEKSSVSGNVNIPIRYHKKKDGTLMTVCISAGPFILKGRKVMYSILRDVTEQLEMEQELKIAKDNLEMQMGLLENILSTIPNQVFWKGLNLNYMGCNKKFAEVVGLSHPKEVVNKSDFDFVRDSAHAESYRTFDRKLIKTKKAIIDLQEKYHTAEGEEGYVLTSKVPLEDESGKVYGLLGICTDISELKNTQKELVQAKDKAETANRAKSIFLANMSHEIRTPLNAVIGFSDILNTLITDSQHKEYLDSIKSSGNTLLSLINNILDLSKIEAGGMDIKIEAVDLREIINETKSIFSLKSNQKDIKIITDIADSIPEVLLLDELRIRQILINLVGNALKFTNKGYVKISCFTYNTLNNKCDLEIIVEDTGIGISESAQKIIFDVFKQQDDQDARKYGGTGLGLSISEKLVKIMGGEISVKSKENSGSSFSIKLKKVKFSTENPDYKSKPEIDYTQIDFDEATILVVDDTISNRNLIKGFFKETKIKVIEAENGMVGEHFALKYLPDLILMDIRMPVSDGYEATENIKNNNKTKQIPIVAFTASANLKDEAEIMKRGFNAFLRKPVQLSDVFIQVSKFLKHRLKEKNIELSQKEIKEEFPELTKEKLSEIIQILESDFLNKSNSFSEIIDVDEVVDFGESLQEFSRKHELTGFNNLANDLISSASDFNFDKISGILISFAQKIEQLKSQKRY